MNERVRGILNGIKDFWNKFNNKQRAIIISSVIIVILLIALVAWIFSRPNLAVLVTCKNYNEVSSVETLLKENAYNYKIDDDALTVRVDKKDLVNAKILLGANDIQADGYTLKDSLSGGFSATEKDKEAIRNAALETKLANDLMSFDVVNKASVSITKSASTSVLTESKSETSVAVVLKLNGTMEEEMGEYIAHWIKTAVGNESTKHISIITTTGLAIFTGSDSSDTMHSLTNQQKYTATITNTMKNGIKNTLLKLPMYDDAQISLNLDINYDAVEEIIHNYSAQDGREEGLLTESYEEVSNGTTGVGGTPGTASNDDTTYYFQNSDGSTSTITIKKNAYQPNEFVSTTVKTPGEIIKSGSTVSVVLHDNIVYEYDEVEKAGLLKDMSWEEFKTANGKAEKLEVEDEIVQLVSNGTGIPAANITVMAYSVPYFMEKQEASTSRSFWIMIAVAAGIVLLLAFVIFRSAKPVTVQETEPELSVEEMLSTTRERQTQSVEDIDLQEKSEVRIAIEKFVDENPEAVALLLRNWLDDGWD